MEWGDIRIFLAVVRSGTLGAAARALKLSHPTIGRRLRALEADTGQTLFQRTSEGFVLTDEGKAILALAEQMEESALAMERRLAGEGEQLDGMLRISSADWFGAYVLPPILAEFTRSHPNVSVELVTGARLFNLSRREADLVFRIVPFDEPDIVQRRLMTLDYALYAGQSVPDPVAGDGTGSAIITMDTALSGFPDVAWLQRLLPNARTALRSNNRSVQARMCALGIGLAVLPCAIGDNVAGLRRVDLGEPPPRRDMWLGYHRDLRRLRRLRAMLDVALRVLAD
ncbi:LysR family transcriptional regulator [Sphingomonas oleivorans]|uniref:LysR family transcriptional regulator n=1 Tax=Sphingomonas oleivorans TaxID=1735121 RepID=A0A2T5G1K1_9SPHN|nr:LysR family transcriptional regulator [Sphingomonas oleivorans]PTQ13023.1 LysR family transcriptional regulator [Sphingomonas oleivorans]